jgi:hypothetical protein
MTWMTCSAPTGYLRKGVELDPGEELATAPGHAEVSVLQHMKENGIKPTTVGAGRPICDECASGIRDVNAVPATALKNPDVVRSMQATGGG